ncbi:hypothetical protein ABKY47_002644 [Aeromonas hydrophila]
MKMNRLTVSLSLLSASLLVNSGVAMAATEHRANFTANITASIPDDFKFTTVDGADHIDLTFPDSTFNQIDNSFEDQFKEVKITGSGVVSTSSVTVTADNLELTAENGDKIGMVVMFNNKPEISELDDLLINAPGKTVTLGPATSIQLGKFYVGYNTNGQASKAGTYKGSIVLTASAEL